MKLIGSLASPYVRKVRVVLAEKKLDYNFILEDVWGSDAILASNPLGKVPCLVMEGGEAVFDSRVIVEYVDTLSPVGKLIPGSGRERVEVRTWEALADGLLDAAYIRPPMPLADGIQATTVHHDRFVLAIPVDSPLAASASVKPAQLHDQCFVLPEQEAPTFEVARRGRFAPARRTCSARYPRPTTMAMSVSANAAFIVGA